MEHRLYKTGDQGIPKAILDRNEEVVLDACKVCGGAESAMPTSCPGRLMSPQELDDVTTGEMDFRGEKWVTPNAGGNSADTALSCQSGVAQRSES